MKENLEKNKGKEEKLATAITYEESEQVPKVVATGKGHIAEKIIEEGEKENITIYKAKKYGKKEEVKEETKETKTTKTKKKTTKKTKTTK